ncbi:MAG: hypothetical protein KDD04_09600 [Sinomicrobium sp.]|nr:hypothetical protein [Sinomicrobium sp.]
MGKGLVMIRFFVFPMSVFVLSFSLAHVAQAQDLFNGDDDSSSSSSSDDSGASTDLFNKGKPTYYKKPTSSTDLYNSGDGRGSKSSKSLKELSDDARANRMADINKAVSDSKAIDKRVSAEQDKRTAEKEKRRDEEALKADQDSQKLTEARDIAKNKDSSKQKTEKKSSVVVRDKKKSQSSSGSSGGNRLFNTPL